MVRLHLCTTFTEPEQSFFGQSRSYRSFREKSTNVSLGITSLYPLYSETLSLVNRITSESLSFFLENPVRPLFLKSRTSVDNLNLESLESNEHVHRPCGALA